MDLRAAFEECLHTGFNQTSPSLNGSTSSVHAGQPLLPLPQVSDFMQNQQFTMLLLHCEQLMETAIEPLQDHQRYMRESINYYLMGVAGVTVCCFGLVGNLLSLAVLTRKTMRTSTYCYLAALGVCDLLFVACTLMLLLKDLSRPVKNRRSWSMEDVGIYPYVFPYLHPAAFTLQVCCRPIDVSLNCCRPIRRFD